MGKIYYIGKKTSKLLSLYSIIVAFLDYEIDYNVILIDYFC